MSDYTNLVSSLNSNANISKNQKEMLFKYFIQIKNDILDSYLDNYSFDNVSHLIEQLKLVPGKDNDIIYYDKSSNSLVIGKSPNNQVFNTYKSLIKLICQSYNQNNINSGLEVTIDGKKYGSILNDLLIDYIITINTGLISSDDMSVDKINSKDVMVFCFEEMAGGASSLMNYFAYGEGDKLYSKISEMLGEENTKELYSENVSIDRLLFSARACTLKREQSNNDVPKM